MAVGEVVVTSKIAIIIVEVAAKVGAGDEAVAEVIEVEEVAIVAEVVDEDAPAVAVVVAVVVAGPVAEDVDVVANAYHLVM